MPIEKVSVLGGGLMGTGISQALAQQGYTVPFCDVKEEILEKSLASVKRNLQGLVDRGRMTAEEAEAVRSRLQPTTSVPDLADADLVIEAVSENMEIKKQLFAELDRLCPPHTILATNTSILSPTEIGSVTKRQDKTIGMHWFNPAPVMKLIEVVAGQWTSPETVETIMEFARSVGKTPVKVNEAPGFIVNRIGMAIRATAIELLQEGVASVEDIDTAMKLGSGFAMGPFEVADLVGLDLAVTNMENMYRELGDSKYAPPPLLKKMVRAGLLGRKSGRGFYDYRK